MVTGTHLHCSWSATMELGSPLALLVIQEWFEEALRACNLDSLHHSLIFHMHLSILQGAKIVKPLRPSCFEPICRRHSGYNQPTLVIVLEMQLVAFIRPKPIPILSSTKLSFMQLHMHLVINFFLRMKRLAWAAHLRLLVWSSILRLLALCSHRVSFFRRCIPS